VDHIFTLIVMQCAEILREHRTPVAEQWDCYVTLAISFQ